MIRYHLPIYTNASTDSVLTYGKGKETTKGYVQIIKQNKWVRLKTIDLYPLPGKTMDIVLQGTCTVDLFTTRVNMLIDTGCCLSFVFRQGLIPIKYLSRPIQPMHITTADGSPMEGGNLV